jgi:hypothetical protein
MAATVCTSITTCFVQTSLASSSRKAVVASPVVGELSLLFFMLCNYLGTMNIADNLG